MGYSTEIFRYYTFLDIFEIEILEDILSVYAILLTLYEYYVRPDFLFKIQFWAFKVKYLLSCFIFDHVFGYNSEMVFKHGFLLSRKKNKSLISLLYSNIKSEF